MLFRSPHFGGKEIPLRGSDRGRSSFDSTRLPDTILNPISAPCHQDSVPDDAPTGFEGGSTVTLEPNPTTAVRRPRRRSCRYSRARSEETQRCPAITPAPGAFTPARHPLYIRRNKRSACQRELRHWRCRNICCRQQLSEVTRSPIGWLIARCCRNPFHGPG